MPAFRAPLLALLATALCAASAAAQTGPPPPSPAATALAACAAAAGAGDQSGARQAARTAEALYREQLRASPRSADARVGLARVISECRIRFANLMAAGRLAAESTRLLEEALEIEPAHWTGRFALAMNHFHAPAFLGRGNDARRELETLIRQQGGAAPAPHHALPYLHLGDLHRREGRHAEARRVWQSGAELWPEDPRLRERLGAAQSAGSLEAAQPGQAPAYALDEIRVTTRRLASQPTVAAVSLNRLEVLTAPGGTADLLHGLRMQGGITLANDGSDLFVRGGDPAEAPVWLDGGRMFHPGTFESLNGSLFGVLNPTVMREAIFFSGGFSARYGNALSGVLDVQSEGRPAQRRFQAGVDLAGGRGSAFLPVNERLGVWANGRLTDAALLVRMQGLGAEYTRSPRAGDITAGVVATPWRGAELKAITVLQGDGATRTVTSHGHHGDFQSRGRTAHTVLSGRATRADGAQLRGALTRSLRETGFAFGALDREREDLSTGASLAATLPLNPRATLHAGAEATRYHTSEAGSLPLAGSVAPGAPVEPVSSSARDRHLGAFAELETQLAPRFSLTAGVRADRLPGESVTTVDPRAALALHLDAWTLRLAGGTFHQGRWRQGYTIPDEGRPAGLARRAHHLVLGAEHGQLLRVEGYRKGYDRFVPHGSGPQTIAATVHGVDARLRWTGGERLSGWVTYSLLDAEAELESGERVRGRLDVTHGLTAVTRLSVGSGWEVGTTARWATGRPFTPVTGSWTGDDGRFRPVLGEIHSERLPDFRRLDARVTRVSVHGGRQLVTYLELLNALDRGNVTGYTYDASYQARAPVRSFFANRMAMLGAELVLR
jgi:vitamin B12 transporter